MKLSDSQAKQRFADFGIPISGSMIATTAEQVFQISYELGSAVIIKPQLTLSDSAAKTAQTPDEAQLYAQVMLDAEWNGSRDEGVIVEPLMDDGKRFRVSVALDYRIGKPTLIAFAEHAAESIEYISIREPIDPLLGIHAHQIVSTASELNLPRESWRIFSQIIQRLYRCYIESDAVLAELVLQISNVENSIVATAGSMVVDSRALFRHPEFINKDATNEIMGAWEYTVQSEGQIGCITNGIGLMMAVLDLIHLYGGNAADFISVANGASIDKLVQALEVMTSNPKVRVLLINLFETSTSCEEMAVRLCEALNKINKHLPVFVRLQGESALKGLDILSTILGERFFTADTLQDLVQQAVRFVDVETE